MAKKVWKNHSGDTVPAAYVPTLDKERERVALKIYNKAKRLNESLQAFKELALTEADAVFDKMLADNNVDRERKGNFSITTFDKQIKIEVNVQERIDFDDQIQVAQAKINEFIEQKTNGIDPELTELINSAFQTNKGRMDVKRVLSLFNLKINHPLWKEAMELIKQSISRNSSKRYMRVWKKDKNGEYLAVELNFSSI